MPDLATAPALLLAVALGAYLLGSVPFGIVAARIFGLGDLRAIGSGNIGATNVLRTGNRAAAAFTLVGDAGKGAAAVALALWLTGRDGGQVAAVAAFLGHAFPVWLAFRGGKAVATFLGVALVLAWPVGLALCATWAATAAVGRISSLAALAAAASAPFWAAWLAPDMVALMAVLGVLVLAFHRANIRRILGGTEPRIGAKR
jgi:glycerol-3-phosphate acyltransferase PlsY